MTEKRFELAYEKDNWWAVRDGEITLWKEEVISLLNEQDKTIKKLVKENKHLRCIIKSNSKDDYIDYLEKQNERLTERITELACNDKIVFMNR